MNPESAFAAQHRLADWIENTAVSAKARYAFLALFNKQEYRDPKKYGYEPELVTATREHVQQEYRMLRHGQPVFVTEEVMDLVDEAVQEMPSEVLLGQDLPFEELVLWLERPIPYHPVVNAEVDGAEPVAVTEHWNIDAIGFSYRPGGVVPMFDHSWNRQDFFGKAVDHPDAVDGVVAHLYVDPAKVSRHIGYTSPILVGPYALIDNIGMAFDIDWAERANLYPVLDDEDRLVVRNIHKWLIALFRLMGEHIEISVGHLPRQTMRAHARAGHQPPKDGYLSILHLRKITYDVDGESGTGRKLRFRIRVRGHWHKYYCSSRGYPVGDPKAYRHNYVNSYVKGPGDGPPVESHRVVVVDR